MKKTSRIPGLHKMSITERIAALKKFADLTDAESALLGQSSVLGMDVAERMIENTIGTFELPLGLVPNMKVNGREVLVPMATEESSVIAALANAGKMTSSGGGYFTSSSDPIMIAQLQAIDVADPFAAKMKIFEHKEEIIAIANEQDPILVKFGGGCRDIEIRVIDTSQGPMVVTHILVDTRDAMGANAVNTMAEAIAPHIEKWTGGKVVLRILSNLADRRIARVRCLVKKDAISPGPEVIDGIVSAWAFADTDPYRATTNNKGIMNGISSLVVATGNDTRAIEAGAHAYASRTGRYRALARWEKDADGNLVGSMELPLAMGLVGGATAIHPMAKLVVKVLGVKTATELAEITAAVGLGQNLSALRALASEGIQRGHMSLHAKNIAVMAGAQGEEIDLVATRLVAEGKVRADRAEAILKQVRQSTC